jgi:hypothetical protein
VLLVTEQLTSGDVEVPPIFFVSPARKEKKHQFPAFYVYVYFCLIELPRAFYELHSKFIIRNLHQMK